MNGERPEMRPEGRHRTPDGPTATEITLHEQISDGLIDASRSGEEIDEPTAKRIAQALGAAIGPNSALAGYANGGAGDYERLREEYLSLYTDPTTPEEIRSWIDWLGTYLVQRENTGSGRQFMNEHLPPKLAQLLVRTEVTVGGKQFTVHLPASCGEAGISDLAETLTELSLDEDPALQAFLSLPDVNAMSGDIMESFHEQYVATFTSIEDAVGEIAEVDEIERDVHDYAEQRHLFIEGVTPDYEALRETAENGYDFVEREGRVYVFYK